MGPLTAFVWLALAGGRPNAADASWTASLPLWTSLSPSGKVIDAGPAAKWGSPPPAARLGMLPEMPRPAPEALPRPRELPETVSDPVGPILPPGSPAPQLLISPLTLPPIVARREPSSPPVAVQATQRWPIRSAGDAYTPGKSFVPRGTEPDEPAARIVLPKP